MASKKVLLILLLLVMLGIASVAIGIDAYMDKISSKRDITLIGDINNNPSVYDGKSVTVIGEYRGWQSELGHGPPVTRSDWILRDETGEIYITGKSPRLDPIRDIGHNLLVTGIVKISKYNYPYIDAKNIRSEKLE